MTISVIKTAINMGPALEKKKIPNIIIMNIISFKLKIIGKITWGRSLEALFNQVALAKFFRERNISKKMRKIKDERDFFLQGIQSD